MPPPASFLLVSSLSYSRVVTQSEFNAGTYGSAANEVWFKYVPAIDEMLGLYATSGGTFTPRIILYETDALVEIDNVHDSAWHAKLTSGLHYWIKVTRTGGGASNFDFELSLSSRTLTPTIEAGDLVINDDEDGQPACVLSQDGVVKGFVDGIPGGELGDSLPDGVQLWHDRYQRHGTFLALFDADLAFVAAPDLASPMLSNFPCFSNHGGKFYVALNEPARKGQIYTVDSGGAFSSLVANIGDFTNAIGISRDGTVCYFVRAGHLTKKIEKWDLVNDVLIGDFYTPSDPISSLSRTGINGHPGEILVLPDWSVVTSGDNGTTSSATSWLYHISTTGALLHSYSFPGTTGLIDHISHSADSPGYVNLWLYVAADTGTGDIRHFKLRDGSNDHAFTIPLFSFGESLVDPSINASPWGPSSSCAMVTAKRSELVASSPSVLVNNSAECCSGPGVEGSGAPAPGAGVEKVGQVDPTWSSRVPGGGTVPSHPDLTDSEDWSA